MGELGVGRQCRHLEQGAEDQPEEVELAQLMDFAAGAGQLGQQDVLADEEEEQDHQRDLHVARQEPAPHPGWRGGLRRARGTPGRRAPGRWDSWVARDLRLPLRRSSASIATHACTSGHLRNRLFGSAQLPSWTPCPPEAPETWRSKFSGSAERRGIPLGTIVVSVAVVILLLDLNAALILGLWVLRTIVVYVVIAFFITLLLTPATRFLRRQGLSHGGAVLLVFLLGVAGPRRPGVPLRRAAGHGRGPLRQAGADTSIRETKKGRGPLGRLVYRLHLQKYLSEDSAKLTSQITKVLKPATALSVGRRRGVDASSPW